MNFKTSDGVQLSYTDNNNGKQPIIFLSGYSGTKEEWQAQKRFFKNDYRVITLDHRNHGESATTQKNLRISRLSQDLFELIDELSLKQVVLVGHSMGSAVIWAYISLHSDKNVKKIITVDESPKTLNEDNWKFGALSLTWNNVAIRSRDIENTKMIRGHIDDDLFQLLKEKQKLNPFNYDLNNRLLINHLVQDWRDVIMDISVPQLFIGSEHSPIWSALFVDECMKLVSDPNKSQKYIFHKSGHLPHMEEPQLFNKIIAKFIN